MDEIAEFLMGISALAGIVCLFYPLFWLGVPIAAVVFILALCVKGDRYG